MSSTTVAQDLTVYDFTFDPNEETPPQKKKKQCTPIRAKPKPKVVYLKQNYDDNISKTLESLKATVRQRNPNSSLNEKPANGGSNYTFPDKSFSVDSAQNIRDTDKENHVPSIKRKSEDSQTSPDITKNSKPKIRSPLNDNPKHILNKTVGKKPKHSQGSPWRAEFNDLPRKLHGNPHISPKLNPNVQTPKAIVETKHVNTKLIGEKSLPHIFGDNTEHKMKQTTIVSFIKENITQNKAIEEKNSSKMSSFECMVNNGNGLIENGEEPAVLFEDVDIVHHIRPSRKSYGKSAKGVVEPKSNENLGNYLEEDPFTLPRAKIPTPKEKKAIKLTKKEEEEVAAWTAAFNLMCDEVDEFPLVVE